MFCQGMTRCYAHEQAPGMALRCQSLGYLCSFFICPFGMPGMTLVILGIHDIRLLGEPAPDLRFACRASIAPPALGGTFLYGM